MRVKQQKIGNIVKFDSEIATCLKIKPCLKSKLCVRGYQTWFFYEKCEKQKVFYKITIGVLISFIIEAPVWVAAIL